MTLTRQAQSVTGVRRRSAVLCPGRHCGRPGHRADAGRATAPVEEEARALPRGHPPGAVRDDTADVRFEF